MTAWYWVMGVLALGVVSWLVCYLVRQFERRRLWLQRQLWNQRPSMQPGTDSDAERIIRREMALRQARQWLRRHSGREHARYPLGVDVARYFNRQDTASDGTTGETLDQRLRQAGIDPASIDIPPEVEAIEEALAPPHATDGRNEGFFERLETDPD